MIIELPVELVVAISFSLIPVGIIIIRYFWKKAESFTLMKQKIEDLSKSDSGSENIHDELHAEMNKYGNRITAVETKLDILLNHFDIKYTQ